MLERKYYDDFTTDYGWIYSNTALTGLWTRSDPNGTFPLNGLQLCNPQHDMATDLGVNCFMTGNGAGSCSTDDVDGGDVILTSPAMALSVYSDAVLTFIYWFYNEGGNLVPNDHFEVHVSNGISEVTVFSTDISASVWQEAPTIHLSNFIALNDNVKVSFQTADDSLAHIVEAAVDVFSVVPQLVNSSEIATKVDFTFSPNPSSSGFNLQYSWPGVENAVLEVHNVLGQVVFSRLIEGDDAKCTFGEGWPAGVYMAHLSSGSQKSNILKIIKSN